MSEDKTRLVRSMGHTPSRHDSFGDDRLKRASFHPGGFIQCSEVQRTEFLNLLDTCQISQSLRVL